VRVLQEERMRKRRNMERRRGEERCGNGRRERSHF
jgi:hypothetical protein